LSVAYYVVFEKEIPGFDPSVNGKAAAGAADLLDALAKRRSVPTLMSYFSVSAEEVAALAADHGLDPGQAPAEKWFSAEDGLKTIDAIIEEGKRNSLMSVF
jgi:hypothetical protein